MRAIGARRIFTAVCICLPWSVSTAVAQNPEKFERVIPGPKPRTAPAAPKAPPAPAAPREEPAPAIPQGPIAGINKTPAHLCQPGTMRFVTTTRTLSLPNDRYCTDADWNVRDVRVEGITLLWTVPFTNGRVDCSCAHISARR